NTGYKIQVMVITYNDFNQFMRRVYSIATLNGGNGIHKTVTGTQVMTASYSGTERRKHQRFGRRIKIKYECNNVQFIDMSINISQSGVLVNSKSPIPLKTDIVLRLELPTLPNDIIAISSVARVYQVEKHIYNIAFCFINMDANDSNRLTEFVRFFHK
ncbi:MAG: PilZ domain-containing protein, partial [Pseudomonadota bacterium]